ncbi:hypothetical protein DSO57_1028221 [Entomophthora muscae]|uniref:Uncharacterized protein n=1 Tax=Entomophthora muscae TaxID=34485 RepID=A0ACC2U054_9FUNG|nr:hypothetical protein DSO57_1028221 [Entomophthora muscae]
MAKLGGVEVLCGTDLSPSITGSGTAVGSSIATSFQDLFLCTKVHHGGVGLGGNRVVNLGINSHNEDGLWGKVDYLVRVGFPWHLSVNAAT